jgi:hypothetical protein
MLATGEETHYNPGCSFMLLAGSLRSAAASKRGGDEGHTLMSMSVYN